jgi:group I intron endonuclease
MNIIDLIGCEKSLATLTGVIYPTFPLRNFKTLMEVRAFLNKNNGIYCWFDLETRKAYIGSSKNLWKRFLSYKNSFFYGKTNRINVKLLNRVKKAGNENIKFFVLEIFNGDEMGLRSLEQKYLDDCQPFGEYGFNIQKNTITYKKALLDQEVIRRIKEANTGENSSNAILTDEKVILIKKFIICGEKLTYIANKFNVSTTVISNIKRGLTWGHIRLSEEEEGKLKILTDKHKRKNLPIELIKSIKRDINSGIKMGELAKKYSLKYTCISGLKYGHFYKDINP